MDDATIGTPPDTPSAGPGRAAVHALRAVEWSVGALVAALVTAYPLPPVAGPDLPRRRLRLFRRVVELALVCDVIVAAVLFVIAAAFLQTLNDTAGKPLADPLPLALAAASSLPLVLRTRYPLAAWRTSLLALLWASLSLRALLEIPIAPTGTLVYLLCLYTVVARSDRRVAVGASLATLITVLGSELLRGAGSLPAPSIVQWVAVLPAVPLLFGHQVRARRSAQAELADSEQRNEEAQAARAVLQERSRIARELHDVVAHHMSVIAIQAEAAPLRSPDAGPALRSDLADIRRTALEALTDLRRVLGVLRQEGSAPDAPQPGLDRLGELAENATAAGLAVTVAVTGTSRPVPTGVGVSAYRIVQESLSNAMRHAPGATVAADVGYVDAPPALRVQVENGPPPGGRPPPEARDGARHGLVGMRERAAMLRGELSAGSVPGGGFAVVATLPLEPA